MTQMLITTQEIYLPKLQNIFIQLNAEDLGLEQTQIFPFRKLGSKRNTDITYKSQRTPGIGLRIMPSKERIESELYSFQ